MKLVQLVEQQTGYIFGEGLEVYTFNGQKGNLEKMQSIKSSEAKEICSSLSPLALDDVNFVDVDWELRPDFPALALLGPSIYHGTNAKLYVVWNQHMFDNFGEIFESVFLVKDFGEGKNKISIGVLNFENIKLFEDRHHIRVKFNLV
jgi:hypothetical protein